MISHLNSLVREIETKIQLCDGDVVVDIGSNDSTLLQSYNNKQLCRVGIDPTGTQFKQYYPTDVTLIPDFFSGKVYKQNFGNVKCKVVTTISMFYDLPDPVSFVRDIKSILSHDGIWVSEQSYAVTMLEKNSFDTICHEHLEYYTLKQFQYLANIADLKIVDVSLNECNGGSFRITLAHSQNNNICVNSCAIDKILLMESNLNDETLSTFVHRCQDLKLNLTEYLHNQKASGKTIFLYGASTKGNTLLQYYGLDNTIISYAAERNPEKYGRLTPGTNIPIISEAEMRLHKPDFLLVLPWHFKSEFLSREKAYLEAGGTIIFPLPLLEIYKL
jgi:hypothetical protein